MAARETPHWAATSLNGIRAFCERMPSIFLSKKVVERISAIQEVVECHFTTGPYTMLVKLYAKDNEQLMDLLNNQLQGIPGVVSTETLISLEQSIKREVPISEDLL